MKKLIPERKETRAQAVQLDCFGKFFQDMTSQREN
jgi:hypothetical protein